MALHRAALLTFCLHVRALHHLPCRYLDDRTGPDFEGPVEEFGRAATRFCVLEPRLPQNLRPCFITCNVALVCAHNAAVLAEDAIAGTRVDISGKCVDINVLDQVVGVFQSPLAFDHNTYMGVDMDNTQRGGSCRGDMSVLAAGCLYCESEQPPRQCRPSPSLL